MEFSFPLPQHLNQESIFWQNLTSFYKRFKCFQTESFDQKTTSILLFGARHQITLLCESLHTLDIDLDPGKLEKVLELVEQFCLPHYLLLFERFKYFTMKQNLSETMKNFSYSLGRQASMCEFQDLQDGLLTDGFIHGVCDEKLSKKLETFKNLGFHKLVKMCCDAGTVCTVCGKENIENLCTCQFLPQEISKVNFTDTAKNSNHLSPFEGHDHNESSSFPRDIQNSHVDISTGTRQNNCLFPEATQRLEGNSFHAEQKHSEADIFKLERKKNFNKEKNVLSRLQTGGQVSQLRRGRERKEKTRAYQREKIEMKMPTTTLKSKNLQCFVCKKLYVSKKCLLNHLVSCHSDCKKFSCLHCQEPFANLTVYVSHLESHFSDIGMKRSNTVDIVDESLHESGEKMFACCSCDEKFHRESLFKKHILNEHPDCREYLCKDCLKTYSNVITYARHIRRAHIANAVTDKVNVTCDLCQKQFYKMRNLNIHLKKHLDQDGGSHQCSICDKFFTSHPDLVSHLQTHDPNLSCVCPICGKNSRNPSHLRKHMRSHTGEKPFVCELCGKCYSDSSALKYHQNWHAGAKPHICEICGKKFRSVGEKNKHKRVHSNRHPYVCEHCGKAFRFISNLIEHRRGHSGRRDLVCYICGQTFIYRSGLARHFKFNRCPGNKNDSVKAEISLPLPTIFGQHRLEMSSAE